MADHVPTAQELEAAVIEVIEEVCYRVIVHHALSPLRPPFAPAL